MDKETIFRVLIDRAIFFYHFGYFDFDHTTRKIDRANFLTTLDTLILTIPCVKLIELIFLTTDYTGFPLVISGTLWGVAQKLSLPRPFQFWLRISKNDTNII